MRNQEDQYRKEIHYETQCLKRENQMYFQDNGDEHYIIFNKIQYNNFKYIGMTIGIYYITILDDHPFGILYLIMKNTQTKIQIMKF